MKRSKWIDEYLKEQDFRVVWLAWLTDKQTDTKMDDVQLHLCRQSYKAGYKLGKRSLDDR